MAKVLGGHKRVVWAQAPCHPQRRWRLLAWADLPREEYDRVCPECGKRWLVERKPLVQTADMTMDELEFSPGWTEPGLGRRIG